MFFYYSPYVSADYEVVAMREVSPIFEAYGADTVITSHTIVYERNHAIRDNKKQGYLLFGRWRGKESSSVVDPKGPARPTTSGRCRCLILSSSCIAGNTLKLRAIVFEGKIFDTLVLKK